MTGGDVQAGFDPLVHGCPFRGCVNVAAVYDGVTGDPVACLDHVDLVLERHEAVALYPPIREQLPALHDAW